LIREILVDQGNTPRSYTPMSIMESSGLISGEFSLSEVVVRTNDVAISKIIVTSMGRHAD
jgi:hypothetical protein